jgi:hypothetical protein
MRNDEWSVNKSLIALRGEDMRRIIAVVNLERQAGQLLRGPAVSLVIYAPRLG